jgi:hypothetical protein
MPAPTLHGGRGLLIIRALTDQLSVQRLLSRGMTLRAVKNLHHDERPSTDGGEPVTQRGIAAARPPASG